VEGDRVSLRPRRGARVHLGCGDIPLPRYLNVDLPPDGLSPRSHLPDLQADIETLASPAGMLAEVRLHHVFEHFDRAQALGLLVRWYDWLAPGGVLTLETPDFEACIERYGQATTEERTVILRHVFGSQEAPWAHHRDGWSEPRFRRVLGALGYQVVDCRAGASDEAGLLRNVTVRARKPRAPVARPAREEAAHALLAESTNGSAASELELLDGWRRRLDATLAAPS
jgi:hypothetical protein